MLGNSVEILFAFVIDWLVLSFFLLNFTLLLMIVDCFFFVQNVARWGVDQSAFTTMSKRKTRAHFLLRRASPALTGHCGRLRPLFIKNLHDRRLRPPPSSSSSCFILRLRPSFVVLQRQLVPRVQVE